MVEAAPPAPSCRACSPPATWWTTPTARPSRPPARAACAALDAEGTCATRRPTPRRTGRPTRTRSRPRPRSCGQRHSWTAALANWAGDQRCAPVRIARAVSEEELAARWWPRAAAVGRTVPRGRLGPLVHRHRVHRRRTAVASGAWTGCSTPTLRAAWSRSRPASPATSSASSSEPSAAWALENQGDIDAQTLAGAISPPPTARAAAYRNIRHAGRGDRLVTPTATVLESVAESDRDLLAAPRGVGLGALGVVTRGHAALRADLHARARSTSRDAAGPGARTTSTAAPTAPTTSSCTCSRTPTWR